MPTDTNTLTSSSVDNDNVVCENCNLHQLLVDAQEQNTNTDHTNEIVSNVCVNNNHHTNENNNNNYVNMVHNNNNNIMQNHNTDGSNDDDDDGDSSVPSLRIPALQSLQNTRSTRVNAEHIYHESIGPK